MIISQFMYLEILSVCYSSHLIGVGGVVEDKLNQNNEAVNTSFYSSLSVLYIIAYIQCLHSGICT